MLDLFNQCRVRCVVIISWVNWFKFRTNELQNDSTQTYSNSDNVTPSIS